MSGGIDDGMTWGEAARPTAAETLAYLARIDGADCVDHPERVLLAVAVLRGEFNRLSFLAARAPGPDAINWNQRYHERQARWEELKAQNAAQAERIKELEARPLIPAGAKVEIHTPPMPESELVSYLQRQILDLQKEINRLRGFAARHNTQEAHNG